MKTLLSSFLAFIIFSSFFLLSCNKQAATGLLKRNAFLEDYLTPPGTVRVAENLFADEFELSNLDYKEFLYWTRKVHGDSAYYKSLPDTTVWRSKPKYSEPFVTTYFQHPAFDLYPIVGLTYEQAVNYLNWRSDRVYEMLLIANELIQVNVEQNTETYFSIQKYLSGNYYGYDPDTNMLNIVPIYRLPTETEWEAIAAGGLNPLNSPYGYDPTSKRYQKLMKKKKYRDARLFNTLHPVVEDSAQSKIPIVTAPGKSYFPNNYGLYHTIGNVAEMLATPGLAKGGSFLHPEEECVISNKLDYNEPTRWLGLRAVCSWQPASKYLKLHYQ